jgi:hypothetical protein
VPNKRLIYGDFIVPNADPKVYTEMDDILVLCDLYKYYCDS